MLKVYGNNRGGRMSINIIVTNPIIHRAKDRLAREEYYKNNKRDDMVIFDTLVDTGIGDDDWMCDFCNVPMDVGTVDEPLGLLIHGSYALCEPCVESSKKKYPEEFIDTQVCKCCENGNDIK